MALADLRALAHQDAVTRVTRNPNATGYTGDAEKTAEIRQFHGDVTPGTPVTRDLCNAGTDERTAPINDPVPTMPGMSDADWVEGMAAALMANPVYRITNPDSAMVYFRGRALAMLDRTPDPYARGLLLGAERHRHVMVVHSQATGR